MHPDDPRFFPAAGTAPDFARRLYQLTEDSLTATTGQDAATVDRELSVFLAALLRDAVPAALASAFAHAPSPAVYRHLWRLLAEVARVPTVTDNIALTLFAMPLVIVAGIEGGRDAHAMLPGILSDPDALAARLREHQALAGNENFTLARGLVAADALDLARLPALTQAIGREGARIATVDLPPAPIAVTGGVESVHLRFIVGTALAAPGADLLRDGEVGAWGIPVAQMLTAQLAPAGVSLLALPRAPQNLLSAVAQGRAAQREVGAQIFASNAIRKLRAAVGEPTAVISAHRGSLPETAGELRLSLSSPFDTREAEGFRCPLYPLDRVPDVVGMLVDLMRDCRVDDVRVLPGVHPDRNPVTGQPLLFKAENLGSATPLIH